VVDHAQDQAHSYDHGRGAVRYGNTDGNRVQIIQENGPLSTDGGKGWSRYVRNGNHKRIDKSIGLF
jgi:hypothetical protein